MFITASLLLMLVAVAPGDLYRCVGNDGKVSFQDRPCPGGSAPGLRSGHDGKAPSDTELRAWLRELRANTLPAAPASAARRPAARPAGAPMDEPTLAVCSGLFLACADDRAARMDDCVLRMPRCNTAAGADSCCPAQAIDRYLGLRRAGAPLATATREALLGN